MGRRRRATPTAPDLHVVASEETPPATGPAVAEEGNVEARVISAGVEEDVLGRDVIGRMIPMLKNLTRLPSGEHRYAPPSSSPYDGPPAVTEVQKGVFHDPQEAEHSNVLPSADDVHTLFTMAGALFPPYDPEVLVTLYEHSSAMRPCVDAYATNIELFGYRLEPVIDLDKSDATEKVGDAMFLERMRAVERMGSLTPQADYPTPEEIANRIVEIRALMRLEHAKLSNFFEHCASDTSFKQLRKHSRVDLEVTGNAYWEVLRNKTGEIAQLVYVPGYSIRLIPIEHRHHEYTEYRKISALSYEPVVLRRRFRRYVQVVLDRIVHFKEFGDPRVISRKTGREYPNEEELRAADAHDGPATEILHFRVHSPRSPYGIPRWIGNLLSVLGSRACEEVNYLYFDSKAVPPLAVLVSGGRLTPASVSKIESYVRDNLKGKTNFHRILVLEAESGRPAGIQDNGRVRIMLQPLMEAQLKDALFQNYDEKNIDKVGMSFRLPRMLRGDIRDFNRSTADAALQFAEVQVFQPEREEFDAIINRRILSDLQIRFWTFTSKSPVNRNPMDVATMTSQFATTNALVPNEIRELATEVFNREFKPLDDEWAKQPMAMTLAGVIPPGDILEADDLPPPGTPDAPTPIGAPAKKPPPAAASPRARAPNASDSDADEQRLRALAVSLSHLRDNLNAAQAKMFKRQLDACRKEIDTDGTVKIVLPKEEIDALFEPGSLP